MGWTNGEGDGGEHLWVAYDTGHVDVFTPLGDETHLGFALLPELTADEVTRAEVAPSGFAALARAGAAADGGSGDGGGGYGLFVVSDVADPIAQHVRDLALVGAPTCMAVLDAAITGSGQVEVLLGTPDCSLVVVAPAGSRNGGDYVAEDQHLAGDGLLPEPALAMAATPDGHLLACFCENGVLVVLRLSPFERVVVFDTKAADIPAQVAWCRDEAVALLWNGRGVLLVGPGKDWLKYAYTEPLVLVQETDCVRLLSDTEHRVLQRVPPFTADIRRIGSIAPAAMLFDALESYDEGDARADEAVRGLKEADSIMDAVFDCLLAAASEWDTDAQRVLLRAASFGKHFDPDADFVVEGGGGEGAPEGQLVGIHAAFVACCRKLRVLNALRDAGAGMPLTSDQYDELGAEAVVRRLMGRHQHGLALRLCKYLGLPDAPVLVHWACAKVRAPAAAAIGDEALCALVRRRLASCGDNVSFADIAATADSVGRRALATMLLDAEPRAADQVRALLAMGEHERAVRKAIDSGDTDLVFRALMRMRRAMTAASDDGETDFFRALLPHREAASLLTVYCRARDPAMLKRLYKAYGHYADYGALYVKEAYAATALPERQELLGFAEQVFAAGAAKSAPPAAGALRFLEEATSEHMRLLAAQDALDEAAAASGGASGRRARVDGELLDGSLNGTLAALIARGAGARAVELAKDFQVPEARFATLKVRALAGAGEWDALHGFAREQHKKKGIGMAAFAEAAEAAGRLDDVARYASMMSDADARLTWLVRGRAWREAAREAARQHDAVRLAEIRDACGDKALAREVEGLIAGL